MNITAVPENIASLGEVDAGQVVRARGKVWLTLPHQPCITFHSGDYLLLNLESHKIITARASEKVTVIGHELILKG